MAHFEQILPTAAYRERPADMILLLKLLGRKIGSTCWGMFDFYVMDGKAYRVASSEDWVGAMDYFEFCSQIRQGMFDTFTPEGTFHLRGRQIDGQGGYLGGHCYPMTAAEREAEYVKGGGA